MMRKMNQIFSNELGCFCRPHVPLTARLDEFQTRKGLLSGLTFAVKDNYDVKGIVTGGGNPCWLKSSKAAEQSAEVIRECLEEGAQLVGRTAMDELAYAMFGENHHYGTPINPAAPQCIPGGSSSGSAVATAAGLADFALGSDTLCSVRLPASYCGVYGFRPSHGRISTTGVLPLSQTFDTVGWFARDATTLWRVGQVLLGRDKRSKRDQVAAGCLRKVRIIVPMDMLSIVDGPVEEAIRDAIRGVASDVDAHVTEIDHLVPPSISMEQMVECFNILQAKDVWDNFGGWVAKSSPHFGPGVKERFQNASRITNEQTSRQKEIRQQVSHSIHKFLKVTAATGGDTLTLLALPSAPGAASLRGIADGNPEEALRVRFGVQRLQCLSPLAGTPQASLPFAMVEGKPLGLALMAAKGRDTDLLNLIRDLRDPRPVYSAHLEAVFNVSHNQFS